MRPQRLSGVPFHLFVHGVSGARRFSVGVVSLCALYLGGISMTISQKRRYLFFEKLIRPELQCQCETLKIVE